MHITLPIGWPGNVSEGLLSCCAQWRLGQAATEKNEPLSPNITLTLRQTLGGLPLQIEIRDPPPQLKSKWLTISLLERNKQAVCRKRISTDLDSFV